MNIIQHEYAHYMNHELHGIDIDGPHGKMWEECCNRINSVPRKAIYDEDILLWRLVEERRKKVDEKEAS